MQWVDVLRQKTSLLMLEHKEQLWKLLVDLILNKIPWFKSSPNHLAAIENLSSFCSTVISLNTSTVPIIYNTLIQKIVPR